MGIKQDLQEEKEEYSRQGKNKTFKIPNSYKKFIGKSAKCY